VGLVGGEDAYFGITLRMLEAISCASLPCVLTQRDESTYWLNVVNRTAK
jgi:hypothetical protein